MRKLFIALLSLCSLSLSAGTKETYHVEIVRHITNNLSRVSKVDANLSYVASKFGYFDASELTFTSTGTNKLVAADWETGSIYAVMTNATGHWFNADGSPSSTSTDDSRRVAVKIANGCFCVSHRTNTTSNTYSEPGAEYRFAELMIHGTDTLRYEFHVTLVNSDVEESATSDIPTQTYAHRTDQADGIPFTPLMQQNDNTPQRQNWIQVNAGDRITMAAAPVEENVYDSVYVRLKDADGNYICDWVPQYVMSESATTDLNGQYTLYARLFHGSARVTKNCVVYVDVQEHAGENLSWEGLIPSFGYNFKDEYGEIAQPQNILGEVGETDRNGKPVNRVNGDWWTVCWGSNLNTEVGTDSATVYQAAQNLVKKYDTDFAYIRDVMGWPPDIRARKGYKSTVYIFGSGLKCDNTANTEKGGYQSAIWYSDPKTGISMNWPCVWASYYPFSRFRSDADKKFSDGEYQREAMIHEGIHALFADMDGVKNSAWFHEAGNTWLQSAMAVKRSGTYGTPGFLDGCPFVAPFMPIECYSGWLQDGSFGGPSAEGVNMYNSSGQQVCTWRTYLGGNQYGNSFPIVLSQMCGDASIPWIWRYCKNRVLEGIGDSIGDKNMRNLIMEYRARQALFDIGGWSKGYRSIMDGYFNIGIGPEWEPYNIDCGTWYTTCYQRMRVNDNYGWLAPDETTNPGWSGANIIPIHVSALTDSVRVQFRPEGPQERAMLCYKTKAGNCYYSQMVNCGDMKLNIGNDRPANNVIFAVVCNTDYIYTGDTQRKTHYDYRLRLCEGALGIGGQYKKWYLNEETISDDNYTDLTDVEDVEADEESEDYLDNHLRLMTGMVQSGNDIRLDVTGINPREVGVHIVGIQGVVVDNGTLSDAGTYRMPENLQNGLYVLVFTYHGKQQVYKVIVR